MKANELAKKQKIYEQIFKQAEEYSNQGFYQKAADEYLKAANILPRDKYPEITFECLNYAGFFYIKAGNYPKAESCLKQALFICETELKIDLFAKACILGNLGILYVEKEEYAKAETYYQQILTIYENKKEYINIVKTLNHLGIIHFKNKELDEAKKYYERALSINEKLPIEEQNISIISNLGSLHFAKNDLSKAEEYYQLFLSISEKKLGKEHPDIALTLKNLGDVSVKKNEFDKAKKYYQQALAINEKFLGSKHHITNEIKESLIYTNKELGLELENLKNKAALYQANKLAYLGQMATMMAHNINNPVGIIALKATSALSDLKENLFDANTELEPLLNGILEQTKRLNLMTNNIRQFARSEKIQLSSINLNELINNTYSLLFVAPYQSNNIQFIRNFIEPSPIAHANEFALQEILVSLLSNAKDALKNKTLKTVTISTWQTENNVGFTIEDSGDGITPEKLNDLFTPFRSSKDEGMGLGLYFCKELCKELNGIIEYYRAKQGGAAFKITLQPE
jgi:signal transduction histidine kinase